MESLLLQRNIITLQKIGKILYGVRKTETIDNMQLSPNGIFSYGISHNFVNGELTCGEYSDGVSLKEKDNEYLMFYGGNSEGGNPICVSFGKKVGENLILIREIFSSKTIYKENPELVRCDFFDINEELAYRKISQELNGKLIFNIYSQNPNESIFIQDFIGEKNVDAIEECLDAYRRVFKLK